MNQPQENPNIPSNLAKEIEAVRNKITIGEAEFLRLKDLVKAETYTVTELTKSKIALEEEIVEIEKKCNEAKNRLNTLKKDQSAAETDLNKTKSSAFMILKEFEEMEKSKERLERIVKSI